MKKLVAISVILCMSLAVIAQDGTTYWENGKKKTEGQFKDGKETGNWIYYFSNGKVSMQGNYERK